MGITEMCLRDSDVRVSYGIAPLSPVGTLSEGPQQPAWTVTVPEGLCQRQEAETKQLDPLVTWVWGLWGHA